MNNYQIQVGLRKRLREMSGEQLQQIKQDLDELHREAARLIEKQTGRSFMAVTMELLKAKGLRMKFRPTVQNSSEAPVKRDCMEFLEAWERLRYRQEDRWHSLKSKIENSQADYKDRLDELVAYAELYAGTPDLPINDPVGGYARWQLIDAIASRLGALAKVEVLSTIGTHSDDDTA